MKILKIILGLIVLIVVAGAGAGFALDPKVSERNTLTIDAPVDKVFALVANPTRTKEWLPSGIGTIDKTEVKAKGVAEKAAGALLDAAMGGGTNAGKSAPTHIHTFADGKTLALQTTELKPNEKYMERVVETDMPLKNFMVVPGLEWGFEMQKNAADPKKTDLTVVMTGEATKPLGNVMHHVGSVFGMAKRNNEVMIRMVESAAKK